MASIRSITQGMSGQDAAALIRENDIAGTAPDWVAEPYTGPYLVSRGDKIYRLPAALSAAADEEPGVSNKWVQLGGGALDVEGGALSYAKGRELGGNFNLPYEYANRRFTAESAAASTTDTLYWNEASVLPYDGTLNEISVYAISVGVIHILVLRPVTATQMTLISDQSVTAALGWGAKAVNIPVLKGDIVALHARDSTAGFMYASEIADGGLRSSGAYNKTTGTLSNRAQGIPGGVAMGYKMITEQFSAVGSAFDKDSAAAVSSKEVAAKINDINLLGIQKTEGGIFTATTGVRKGQGGTMPHNYDDLSGAARTFATYAPTDRPGRVTKLFAKATVARKVGFCLLSPNSADGFEIKQFTEFNLTVGMNELSVDWDADVGSIVGFNGSGNALPYFHGGNPTGLNYIVLDPRSYGGQGKSLKTVQVNPGYMCLDYEIRYYSGAAHPKTINSFNSLLGNRGLLTKKIANSLDSFRNKSAYPDYYRTRLGRGCVSFIDDDSPIGVFTKTVPKFLARKLPLGIAVIEMVARNEPVLSALKGVLKEPLIEIMTHTLNHMPLDEASIEYARSEINSCYYFLEELGFDVHGYVSPAGRFNINCLDVMAELHRAHYRFDYGDGFNSYDNFYNYGVYRCNFGSDFSRYGNYPLPKTMAQVIADINTAVATGQWLCISLHTDNENTPNFEAELTQILDYIKANNIECLLPRDAWQRYNNIIESDTGYRVSKKGDTFTEPIPLSTWK